MAPETPPSWTTGLRIMERVRREVNSEESHFHGEGEDVFRSLYLTERFGCVPEHLLGEDILVDIRNLYYWVLDGIRQELQERLATEEFLWVLVDPDYDDATRAVLMTEEKVLLYLSRKAWHLYWDSEEEMARELEEWYRAAERRLTGGTTPSPRDPGVKG